MTAGLIHSHKEAWSRYHHSAVFEFYNGAVVFRDNLLLPPTTVKTMKTALGLNYRYDGVGLAAHVYGGRIHSIVRLSTNYRLADFTVLPVTVSTLHEVDYLNIPPNHIKGDPATSRYMTIDAAPQRHPRLVFHNVHPDLLSYGDPRRKQEICQIGKLWHPTSR